MFASLDPEVAAARGVPVRLLGPAFMVLLGCAVALSVQVVGALLVLALLCVPAAAATKVTASPLWVPVLSVLVRDDLHGGRDLHRDRDRDPDQPLRHHDLVRHLCDLPDHRSGPLAARLGTPRSDAATPQVPA